MPDNYNPAVATSMPVNQLSLASTFSTISDLQRTQAATALSQLQALQTTRQYNALAAASQAAARGEDASTAYITSGGDPSGLGAIQNWQANNRFMQSNNGLMPQGLEAEASATNSLSSAAKNRQETSNLAVTNQTLQLEKQQKLMGLRGNIAQGMGTDDDSWNAGIAQLDGHLSPNGLKRLQAAKTPEQRAALKQELINAATPTSDYTAPVSKDPGNTLMTRGQVMNAASPPAAQPSPAQPGAAAPAPAIGPARSPLQGVPPTQLQEQKNYGDYLGKEPGDLADKANIARQQNFTLDQMKQESASWDMGKGAPTLMAAQQYIKPFANAFGNTSFDKPVGDFDAFQKNTGTLVRQAVKEVSSRAAVQEMVMIQNTMPSAGMSRQGFNQIADQMGAVNDFQIAKQHAAQQFRSQNGTLDGFDDQWNQNVTPSAFLVSRMSPQDLHQMSANLQKTPEGRATLNSIKQQITYANKNGLF